MKGKFGPVNLSKNENEWVCLKEKLFSKWIHADIMSVVMTSFSNWFLNYDVIKSVIITEIQWIFVTPFTVYYVISVFTLVTQNTKPFPLYTFIYCSLYYVVKKWQTPVLRCKNSGPLIISVWYSVMRH